MTARDHEHRWKRVTHHLLGAGMFGSPNRSSMNEYECECGAKASKWEGREGKVRVFGEDAPYLHTCAACGKQYRDGTPFSKIRLLVETIEVPLCSRGCLARQKEEAHRRAYTRYVASLEAMVRKATKAELRDRALKELERIATEDSDGRLKRLASETLARLSSESLA